MELVIRLAGSLLTSRIIADYVTNSVKSTYLMKGVFIVFVSKPCAQQNSRKSSIIHLLPSARAFPGRFVAIRKEHVAMLRVSECRRKLVFSMPSVSNIANGKTFAKGRILKLVFDAYRGKFVQIISISICKGTDKKKATEVILHRLRVSASFSACFWGFSLFSASF